VEPTARVAADFSIRRTIPISALPAPISQKSSTPCATIQLTDSRQRTAKGGNRTLDILHVATAVHLGAKQFLTFDARQRELAKYAGLRVPL